MASSSVRLNSAVLRQIYSTSASLRSWYSWIIIMRFGVTLRSITRLMWRATSARTGLSSKTKKRQVHTQNRDRRWTVPGFSKCRCTLARPTLNLRLSRRSRSLVQSHRSRLILHACHDVFKHHKMFSCAPAKKLFSCEKNILNLTTNLDNLKHLQYQTDIIRSS